MRNEFGAFWRDRIPTAQHTAVSAWQGACDYRSCFVLRFFENLNASAKAELETVSRVSCFVTSSIICPGAPAHSGPTRGRHQWGGRWRRTASAVGALRGSSPSLGATTAAAEGENELIYDAFGLIGTTSRELE